MWVYISNYNAPTQNKIKWEIHSTTSYNKFLFIMVLIDSEIRLRHSYKTTHFFFRWLMTQDLVSQVGTNSILTYLSFLNLVSWLQFMLLVLKELIRIIETIIFSWQFIRQIKQTFRRQVILKLFTTHILRKLIIAWFNESEVAVDWDTRSLIGHIVCI